MKKSTIKSIQNRNIEQESKDESSVGSESNNDSLDDLELDKISNPRKRELMLIAKYKMQREKLNSKVELIKNLKETLESDEQIKKSLQSKIEQLKFTIENLEEKKIVKGSSDDKRGFYVNLSDENEETSKIYQKKEIDDDKHLNNAQIFDEFSTVRDVDQKVRNGYEYNIGNSALSNIHQNRMYNLDEKNTWGEFFHCMYNFVSSFLPFKNFLKNLKIKYERNLYTLFDLMRFMFLLSILNFLIFVYLLTMHGKDYIYDSENLYCRYFIPCVLFYSRIPSNLGPAFSITYATMTFVFFYFSLMKYISYSNLKQSSEIYFNNQKRFSHLVFNCWNWGNRNPKKYIEQKRNLREDFLKVNKEIQLEQNPLSESHIKIIVKYILRILSFYISLLLLFIYAGFILGSYILKNYLRNNNNFKINYNALDHLIELIPPLLIGLFNIIFPYIIALLPNIERWDFESTLETQKKIRYFIFKIFGLAVIYFLNIYFVLLGNPLSKIMPFMEDPTYNVFNKVCTGSYKLSTDATLLKASGTLGISTQLYSQCAEDDTAINILYIFLAEYIMAKIFETVIFCFHYCFSSSRKAGRNYKFEYKVEENGVNFFSYVIQLFVIIPFFPFIVVIIPLFILIEIFYQMIKLSYMRSKPLSKNFFNQKNGSLMMIFFNFTFVIIVVVNILFYISKIPHSNSTICYNNPKEGNLAFNSNRTCGPLPSYTSASRILLYSLNSLKFFSFLYYVFSDPLTLILLLIFIICYLVYKNYNAETSKFYINEKERENSHFFESIYNKNSNGRINNQYTKKKN